MNFLAQVQSNSGLAFLDYFMKNPTLFVLFLAWILTWKGLALWKAARLSHKWWFIIILIANTAGILEIIYIFLVARKYTVEEKNEIENGANEDTEVESEK